MYRTAVSLLIVLGVLGFTAASAQSTDKLRLSAGVFDVFRYDSTVSLTNTSTGLGVSFNPESTLGLDAEQSVLRTDARYRFNDRHGLAFSWYRISTSANRLLDEEIEWIDDNNNEITIPIDAAVRSSLDYEIIKLAYLWSFYHNDKVELAAGAGLHLASVEIDLDASTTSSGESANRAETFLPLPVVTFRLDYNIAPKLAWHVQSEIFSLSTGDIDGTYVDFQAGVEYRAFEHLGLGLGVGSNALKVVDEDHKERFDFDNRITGFYLFLSGHF